MPENLDKAMTGEPLTPMTESAIAVREMYLSLREAGFSLDEATSIVAKCLAVISIEDQTGG